MKQKGSTTEEKKNHHQNILTPEKTHKY